MIKLRLKWGSNYSNFFKNPFLNKKSNKFNFSVKNSYSSSLPDVASRDDEKQAALIEIKKKNIQFLKEKRFDNLVENKIKNDISSELNNKIFDKIFESPKDDKVETTLDNENLIKFDSSLTESKTEFQTTLERTINLDGNKELSDLLLDKKLDLSKETFKIKSINLQDKDLTEDINNNTELFEMNLGTVKSFPNLKNLNINSNKILEELKENKEYEYDVSILGKKIKDTKEDLNLRSYLTLNEDNKHYISPVIYHDEIESKNEKVNYQDTVISTIMKNPIILIIFLVLGYYIYPNLWRKEYFMALSEDYNNMAILKDKNKYYDYINYRRGLYASVRSNFS